MLGYKYIAQCEQYIAYGTRCASQSYSCVHGSVLIYSYNPDLYICMHPNV